MNDNLAVDYLSRIHFWVAFWSVIQLIFLALGLTAALYVATHLHSSSTAAPAPVVTESTYVPTTFPQIYTPSTSPTSSGACNGSSCAGYTTVR